MGKLRKIGRKIDRGIRKVFGKNGWLKAAATVAALYFLGPAGASTAGSTAGSTAATTASTAASTAATTASTAASTTASVASQFRDITGSVSQFMDKLKFFGTEENPTFLPYGQEIQALGTQLAYDVTKTAIVSEALGSGSDDTVGSTKGVQTIDANEPGISAEAVQAYAVMQPQALPTISLSDPTYAKMAV